VNGKQGGDPAKLAPALVQLTSMAQPPLRWATGADAVETLEHKARTLLPPPTASCRRRSLTTPRSAPGEPHL
jgi:hypothetical protein